MSMVEVGHCARTVVEQAYVSMVDRGRGARTVVDQAYVGMVDRGRSARNAVNLQITSIGLKYECLSLLWLWSHTPHSPELPARWRMFLSVCIV